VSSSATVDAGIAPHPRPHGIAVAAVALVFTASGIAMASAVSRMPEIKGQVHASATELAFALVCVGIGSVVAMPFAGRLVGRFGTARVCGFFATTALVGWSLVPLARSVPELALILLLTGSGVGTWDVAMNVQGSIVERVRSQVLMPLWHGLFSVGGVVGALAGAGAARWGIPLGWQLPVVAAVLLVLVLVGCGVFLPEPTGDVVVAVGDVSGGAPGGDEVSGSGPVPGGDDVPGVYAGQDGDEDSGMAGSVLAPPDRASTEGPPSEPARSAAARPVEAPAGHPNEPPTGRVDMSDPQDPATRVAVRRGITRVEILLGLITLGTALGEGAANDWLAVALVDGRDAPAAIGALTYAGFNLTMALGRFTGGPLIARFGRVASLRTAGVIAAVGVLLLCLVPSTAMAFVGAAAWGLGLAIVFPSAMSAAGEVPGRGGRAIATVSTIGYGGFLLGAPTIGLLAHVMPLLHALLVVAAFAILIVVLAPAARERGRSG
jgi:MFS family permease